MIYNNTFYKKSEMSDVIAAKYATLGDEEKLKFAKSFKDLILRDVFNPKKKNDVLAREGGSEMYDELVGALDFNFESASDVNDFVGILNFFNYVSAHGFEHFQAHDGGAKKYKEGTDTLKSDSPPNKGTYIMTTGTPLEQAVQLKRLINDPNLGFNFQKLALNNFRMRIGAYDALREDVVESARTEPDENHR